MKRAKLIISIFFIWLICMVNMLAAQTTTKEQAETIAANLLTLDSTPLSATLSTAIEKTETFYDADGINPIYYVISLSPAGYIIISADDLIEPVIAFSSTGVFDLSAENPIISLLLNDLSSRISEQIELNLDKRLTGRGRITPSSQKANEKWTFLLNYDASLDYGLSTINDPRVTPLIQSRWSQGTVSGNYCYNYYTPNHYPCGCVATAMSQIMRFFNHPNTGVGTPSFNIYVDGVSQSRKLRGGNGSGGVYNWTSMPLVPTSTSTATQLQAIGTLTHDAGVSVNMSYTDSGSGTDTRKAADAFVNTFDYSNAIKGYNNGNTIVSSDLNKMINSNLNAGIPVMLGITGTAGGHAIVADGYGYHLSSLYHHLNMGWSGSDDAWYNLPNIDSNPSFTSVYKCVYNIYNSGTGEIISGRVTDVNGNPLQGASVFATRSGGGTYSDVSDANGLYAFPRISSDSSYTISATKSGYTFTSQNVSIQKSVNNTSVTNLWEVNFAAGGITDDAYENNDTLATAYDLSTKEIIWLSNINGLGIQADSDWYKISVTAGYERVLIDCRFAHSSGDIDIQLYNASGSLLTSSRSLNNNEFIDYKVSSSGIYYIRVFYGNAGNTYDLWWDDLQPPVADDNYEENDTMATAYDLSNSETVWLSSINGYGIQGDDDWYKIYITTGYERLLLNCNFTHTDGNIDIAVYNSAGTLIRSSTTLTDNETIDFLLPASGTYYIRVYNGNARNTYNLQWDDLIASSADDTYEQNDFIDESYDFSNRENTWLHTIDGYGIQSDDDWFKIDVTSGFQRVLVDCRFFHADGDIDITLYDASGNYLTSSNSITDDEFIDYTVSGAGTYYIKVYYDDAGNTYDLWWDDISPTSGDDAYEPNDTYSSAWTNGTNWEQKWLHRVNGWAIQWDNDWYKIDVTSGYERLFIECLFSDTDGDIDIALYDSYGNILTSSRGIEDEEFIDYTVSSSGSYYIKVYYDNAGNTYDLWWDDLSLLNGDDIYEQNDTISYAWYPGTNWERQWLHSIYGRSVQRDEDWYRIDVTGGYERLLINCKFNHEDGDIDISLYNSNGSLLKSSRSYDDEEFIDYTVPSSGTYYVKVFYGNGGNSYDLWWDDVSPSSGDDAYEENDTLQTAYDISSKETVWLSNINGLGIQADSDWYKIAVTPGYEKVQIDCRFTHSDGDIDVSFYDSTGNFITSSRSTDNDEFINYTVPNSGTYYIKVFYGNTGNTYNLWWDDLKNSIGDINGLDGVNLADAIIGLKILAGINYSNISMGADVNNDGKIGMEEIIYILNTLSQ